MHLTAADLDRPIRHSYRSAEPFHYIAALQYHLPDRPRPASANGIVHRRRDFPRWLASVAVVVDTRCRHTSFIV
jgi:hypothetical protein